MTKVFSNVAETTGCDQLQRKWSDRWKRWATLLSWKRWHGAVPISWLPWRWTQSRFALTDSVNVNVFELLRWITNSIWIVYESGKIQVYHFEMWNQAWIWSIAKSTDRWTTPGRTRSKYMDHHCGRWCGVSKVGNSKQTRGKTRYAVDSAPYEGLSVSISVVLCHFDGHVVFVAFLIMRMKFPCFPFHGRRMTL